jgi:hypothetical protein
VDGWRMQVIAVGARVFEWGWVDRVIVSLGKEFCDGTGTAAIAGSQ